MALLIATALYFLFGLVCGFAFGAVREMVVTPLVGPLIATVIELPLILAALWFLCGVAIRFARLPRRLGPRLAMGALWFVLFLAAEFAIGWALRGWSIPDTLAHFQVPQGALGLSGFFLAAAFPLLRLSRRV